MGIQQRYARLVAELEQRCADAGRDAGEVRLIAVSKTVDLDGVGEALEAHAVDFGENRPDQIVRKAGAFPQARWHFIGNIQSRRIPDIVASSTLIHSLFDLSHAKKIDSCARELGKVQDVLVEVNVSGEESKSGVTPGQARAFVFACCEMENLSVRGLMTMAPIDDLDTARACFKGLKTLADDIRAELEPAQAARFTELSMGMSDDWHEAVAAGSTMVRIGRAIFSDDFE